VISNLVDKSGLEVLRSRLRRQARLLDVLGDESSRDSALAISASLACRDVPLGRHPFLKAMLEHTLAAIYAQDIWQRLPDF
jgi:hypothetical protein